MKNYLLLLFLLVLTNSILAQDTIDLKPYLITTDNLKAQPMVDFTQKKLSGSQFTMVGEQHGIQEAAIFTDFIYELGQKEGYRYLCVETDATAAKMLTAINGSIKKAADFYKKNPIAIPFYNNQDDYFMFENTLKKDGEIWGIDQTFMTQFRPNLAYLMEHASNAAFKSKLKELHLQAETAFQTTVETQQFQSLFIFQYDEASHQSLMALAKTTEEQSIVEQFWKTKEIYGFYFTGESYLNNNVRGQLMKENFLRYYKMAQKKNPFPKVVFKLGANHATKGLTSTNIFDISNLVSELAITNGMRSVHFKVLGIKGSEAVGNPFSKETSARFDHTNDFPKEVQALIKSHSSKYLVLDLEPLRPMCYGKTFTADFKKLIMGFDVLVLVDKAQALQQF
jgi:hypothetical protein